MKIVVPGGTGQLGGVLAREWGQQGHDVVIVARSDSSHARTVHWDGRSAGPWVRELDGADVVVNLAGRTVNCRYTARNLAQMMSSRVDSTRAVGQAIAAAVRPPPVWLQMSTATIYAHRFDAANDEATGIIGGDEPGVPAYWKRSIDIAQAWERELELADTPGTRKLALRTSMVMGADRGGVLDVLLALVRFGLGGAIAGGVQYVSWIHERDFVRALEFLVAHEELEGAINVCAPEPVTQRAHMVGLRGAAEVEIGLPATKWMAELGALVLRTDTELLLKSRRVVPQRLLDAGFVFEHPHWREAARELYARWRVLA